MYIVSACLAGFSCKYNGKDNRHPYIEELVKRGKAIPVCPERLGGLPTPRPSAEQKDGRVINKEGKDVTEAFEKGAQQSLQIAQKHGCRHAIMKANSPSCGCGLIYDGSFSGKLIEGDGKTVQLFKQYGITVSTEDTIEEKLQQENNSEIK